MFSQNNQLSKRQIKRMLLIEIFSTTSLLLPALIVREVDRDGLIPLFIGSLLALVYTNIMVSILDRTRYDYAGFVKKSIGEIGGIVIAVLYFLRFAMRCGFALQLFCQLVLKSLLPDHRLWTVAIPILLLCGYVALKGIEARGRTLELLFFVIFVPIILVLVLALPDVELGRVIPTMQTSLGSLWRGSYGVFLSYGALEFILFSVPHVSEKKGVRKSVIIACGAAVVLNLVIFIVTVGMFGVESSKHSLWPALRIMQTVKLPGGFVERLDILLIAFWVFSMFGILSAYLFYAGHFASKFLPKKSYEWLVLAFMILVYCMVSFAPSLEQSFLLFSKYMAYMDFPLAIGTPILILVIGKVRRVA